MLMHDYASSADESVRLPSVSPRSTIILVQLTNKPQDLAYNNSYLGVNLDHYP